MNKKTATADTENLTQLTTVHFWINIFETIFNFVCYWKTETSQE